MSTGSGIVVITGKGGGDTRRLGGGEWGASSRLKRTRLWNKAMRSGRRTSGMLSVQVE